MENRLIELEIRLSFQDQLIQTLNDALIEQASRLQALELRAARVEATLQSASHTSEAHREELPPHY